MNTKNPSSNMAFLPKNGMRRGSPCLFLCKGMRIYLLGEVRAAKDDLPEFVLHLFFFFTVAVDPLDPQFLVETCLSESLTRLPLTESRRRLGFTLLAIRLGPPHLALD